MSSYIYAKYKIKKINFRREYRKQREGEFSLGTDRSSGLYYDSEYTKPVRRITDLQVGDRVYIREDPFHGLIEVWSRRVDYENYPTNPVWFQFKAVDSWVLETVYDKVPGEFIEYVEGAGYSYPNDGVQGDYYYKLVRKMCEGIYFNHNGNVKRVKSIFLQKDREVKAVKRLYTQLHGIVFKI